MEVTGKRSKIFDPGEIFPLYGGIQCHIVKCQNHTETSANRVSYFIPFGLSLLSEVNRQMRCVSMVDQSLNCDHHCSTATPTEGKMEDN